MLNNTKMRSWIALAILILSIDQISKTWIVARLGLHQTMKFLPNLNLTLTYNNGAAFGLLASADGWQRWLFIAIAVVISIGILFWCSRLTNADRIEGIALSCILGGALGNLMDRIYDGHVIDFIDFYIKNWHWYTFNIADVAVCVGAALLFWTAFKGK